ncbi:MAG TPA: four helix bundle protein [Pirellulales bacterium]|nr:four helix bundle protein [Pirellulales bacterium]
MAYTQDEFKKRTKQFALRVIRLVNSLPTTLAADKIGGQLLKAGTSVAANYRAACRGRSPGEFCAKLGIVEEEADESIFWMELLVDSKMVKSQLVTDLMGEANEILAMVVASIRTAKRKQQR